VPLAPAGDTGGGDMSRENVEIVGQPISVKGRPDPGLEERLAQRFPAALAWFARLVWRLPPRSRLRKAVVRRASTLGLDAANRKDYGAMFVPYHADCESIFPRQLATLGDSGTRGIEQRIDFEKRWRGEWGEFRYVPDVVMDLGEELLILGRLEGSGAGSGALVDSEWAVLFTISGGQIVQERVFFVRQEALEAAGVSE
jgi:ketosteroid isomerase-like protein